MSGHTHHQWRSTIANVAVEVVAEELSPYKEFLQQLYFNKTMEQLLNLVFVFPAATNIVTDEF